MPVGLPGVSVTGSHLSSALTPNFPCSNKCHRLIIHYANHLLVTLECVVVSLEPLLHSAQKRHNPVKLFTITIHYSHSSFPLHVFPEPALPHFIISVTRVLRLPCSGAHIPHLKKITKRNDFFLKLTITYFSKTTILHKHSRIFSLPVYQRLNKPTCSHLQTKVLNSRTFSKKKTKSSLSVPIPRQLRGPGLAVSAPRAMPSAARTAGPARGPRLPRHRPGARPLRAPSPARAPGSRRVRAAPGTRRGSPRAGRCRRGRNARAAGPRPGHRSGPRRRRTLVPGNAPTLPSPRSRPGGAAARFSPPPRRRARASPSHSPRACRRGPAGAARPAQPLMPTVPPARRAEAAAARAPRAGPIPASAAAPAPPGSATRPRTRRQPRARGEPGPAPAPARPRSPCPGAASALRAPRERGEGAERGGGAAGCPPPGPPSLILPAAERPAPHESPSPGPHTCPAPPPPAGGGTAAAALGAAALPGRGTPGAIAPGPPNGGPEDTIL